MENDFSICAGASADKPPNKKTNLPVRIQNYNLGKWKTLKYRNRSTETKVRKLKYGSEKEKPPINSLVLRPLPDFIPQLWRKIGRRSGSKTMSRTGNGGLG